MNINANQILTLCFANKGFKKYLSNDEVKELMQNLSLNLKGSTFYFLETPNQENIDLNLFNFCSDGFVLKEMTLTRIMKMQKMLMVMNLKNKGITVKVKTLTSKYQ